MNGNTPPYCPVCYTSIKTNRDSETEPHVPQRATPATSTARRSDVLLHHGTSIQLFRADGARLRPRFSGVERVPGSWQFQPDDQIFVGDFNGDGKDEVVDLQRRRLGRCPYLGLLADDGAGGLRLIARYDGDIPGWGGFAAHDHFFVADLNGDGKDDLVVVQRRRLVDDLRRAAAQHRQRLHLTHRYDGDIPGWGGLARHDQFFVGDLTGDGKDDLVIFNGYDWSMAVRRPVPRDRRPASR